MARLCNSTLGTGRETRERAGVFAYSNQVISSLAPTGMTRCTGEASTGSMTPLGRYFMSVRFRKTFFRASGRWFLSTEPCTMEVS